MIVEVRLRYPPATQLSEIASFCQLTMGGIEGRSIMMQSASPFPNTNGQPQKERDWLVTVPQRNGTVIFVIFVAPQPDFPRFQPTYEAMVKSVQF